MKKAKILLLNGSPHAYGVTAEDVKKDLEGLQTLRNVAANMAFMIRAFMVFMKYNA